MNPVRGLQERDGLTFHKVVCDTEWHSSLSLHLPPPSRSHIMANVLHPHIDFQPRTVAHAPSPFGFGFGLGPSTSTSMMASTGWGASTPGHTNTAAFHQLVSSVTQSASMRPQKRRMSPDDELEHTRYSVASTSRDESMDRSPSPDRPKLAPPKRARVETIPDSKSNSTSKQNKGNDSHTEDDIDIGVLLG